MVVGCPDVAEGTEMEEEVSGVKLSWASFI
jgi:hypothetical protein